MRHQYQILHLAGSDEHPAVCRILLVLNGADAGSSSVDMTVDLARRLCAQVRVEDVVAQQSGYGGQLMTRDLMSEAARRVDDVRDCLTRAHVAAGGEIAMAQMRSRADTIVEAADAYDADLVVIGIDRLGILLARIGLGTVPKVIRSVHRPVLVVPQSWPRRPVRRSRLSAWLGPLAGVINRTRVCIPPASAGEGLGEGARPGRIPTDPSPQPNPPPLRGREP